jgi:hypothetical protein
MAERVTLEPSKKALAKHLGVPVKDITSKFYVSRDPRIDWETWIVWVRGQAVGFTNQEAL